MAVRIIGTGSCLAEKEVTNDELAKYVDTSDEWISSRTGIKKRRIAIEETTTSMASEAARRALDMAGKDAAEVCKNAGFACALMHFCKNGCILKCPFLQISEVRIFIFGEK